MGTRKKLVLASLVSLMMVMAFAIGLIPAHDASRLQANPGDGNVQMADLLDMILGAKQVTGITVSSPIDGVVVKTPEDNAEVPEIPVPLTAAFESQVGDTVRFAANEADADAFPAESTWQGSPSLITDEVSFPFSTGLDVSPFLTGIAGTETAISIYALVNAELVSQNLNVATYTYQETNDPASALPLSIIETAGSVDADDNGFPDNPFDIIDGIAPGEIWIATVNVNGVLRTVMLANLDTVAKGAALGEVFVSPSGNVQVSSPTLAEFQSAGLIPPGEDGILVVQVADDLEAMIDNFNGNSSQASRQQWEAELLAQAPGTPTGGEFVEVSILYTDGSDFVELEDLTGSGLTVDLTLNNIAKGVDTSIELYSYSTIVDEDAGSIIVTNDPAAEAWRHIPGAVVAGNSVTASLETLSVFATLEVQQAQSIPVSVAGATPSTIDPNVDTEVGLTGVFGTPVALNVAAAQAAYAVYAGDPITGVPLDFTLGPLSGPTAKGQDPDDAAVTPYDGVNNNFMYVIVPAGLAVENTDLDITVVDLLDPTNQDTATDLIQVGDEPDVCSLTLGTQGTGTGTIVADPTNSPGEAVGDYLCGATVQVTATADAGSDFAGFLVDGELTPAGDADGGTIDVTVDGADGTVTSVIAIFNDEIAVEFSLTVNQTAGGTVTVNTAPNGILDPNDYIAGTVVSLTATPAEGFEFTGWGGADGGDVIGGQNGTLVMDSDKVVEAIFQPVQVQGFTLTINTQGAGGSIQVLTPPNGPGGTYLAGTTVNLLAVPDTGNEFVQWIGPVTNTQTAATSVIVNSDVSVTAVFQQIGGGDDPTLTAVTPNEAWIFGGVVATLTGSNFENPVTVSFGGVTAEVTGVSSDAITVIVPANETSADAEFTVDVTVTTGGEQVTLADGFTYIRHLSEGGVNSTAFILANPGVSNEIDVTLGEPHTSDFAQIILPALDTPAGVGTVFGVARNAEVGALEAKGNTTPLAALGTSNIDAGETVDGSFDFTLHLYADASSDVFKNTPPAGSGVFSNATSDLLIDFADRPIDSDGDPQASSPLLLSYPLDGSITYGDVRSGLTFWGTLVDYDYVSRVATVVDPDDVAYESTILNNEVSPANANQAASASPTMVNRARLYTLNGFSLRQGAILSEEDAEGIRLDTATGTASGRPTGGTELCVISPAGGLAWINRVELRNAEGGALLGTVNNFITTPGTDEYELCFTTPAIPNNQSAIVNLVIFANADPTTPLATLNRVFEYRAAPENVTGIVLLLLGLLVAILGLAAGGDSGGGGGPCFIATAAYGTPMAAQIDVLRDVRDTFFLDNAVGTALVDAYYTVSPAIADQVAGSPALAAVVRVALVPVIFIGKLLLAQPALMVLLAMSLGAIYMFRSVRRNRA